MANRKKLESVFQHDLINKLKTIFPGAVVLKNDPDYVQGIPDLIILWNNKWAMLECKRSATASHRPNQDYYVRILNEMSYAAVIYPENEEDILDELQQAFKS